MDETRRGFAKRKGQEDSGEANRDANDIALQHEGQKIYFSRQVIQSYTEIAASMNYDAARVIHGVRLLTDSSQVCTLIKFIDATASTEITVTILSNRC